MVDKYLELILQGAPEEEFCCYCRNNRGMIEDTKFRSIMYITSQFKALLV